jgi:hypothetical protein
MKRETLEKLRSVYPQKQMDINDIIKDMQEEFKDGLIKQNEIFPGRIITAVKPTDITERVYEEGDIKVDICVHICGNDSAKFLVNSMWSYDKTQLIYYCHVMYLKLFKMTGYRYDNGVYRYFFNFFPIQPYVYSEDEVIENVGHLKCFLRNGKDYEGQLVEKIVIDRWCVNKETGAKRAVIGDIWED